MLYIPNSVLTFVAGAAETLGGLSEYASVALQVVPLILVPARDSETAVQALTARESTGGGSAGSGGGGAPASGGGAAVGIPGKHHTVVRGDWLSKIADRYYSNMHKWPVIFAANRRLIGPNPDAIKPGQRLFVPDLPQGRLIAAVELSGSERAIV
jgi:nucleoid-associated protein YgaU